MTIRAFSKLVCNQLTAAGFDPIVALDGMQALMFSKKETFSAIILDISMPGGNGFDALRLLKSSSRTCQVPVIIVSSTGGSESKAKALALGAEAFLAKPISFAELIQVLGTLAIRPTHGSSVEKLRSGDPALTSKTIVRTVMVVDDDRILVKIVCRWLNELGYATLSAYSVAEALKVMGTRLVDLVLLDLEMPGARGTALIKQLKAFNRTSAIRIVVLSGSAEGDEASRLLALGADDFLQKPPTLEAIQRSLAAQFTRSANITDANKQPSPVEGRGSQPSIHEVPRRVSA